MRYEEATPAVVDGLVEVLERELPRLPTLAQAALRLTDLVYDTFTESSVMVRTFATIPYGRLPEYQRKFADTVAGRSATLVAAATPTLTLLATRGTEVAWNDPRASRGHVAIPLASPDHVESIPMVASLMKSLGVAVRAVGDADTSLVTQSIGNVAGIFYVEDARTALDARGRQVIPAQDFVARHGVQSVFGFGGVYALGHVFEATLVFARERVQRRQAERLMRLTNIFKANTLGAVFRGRIFEDTASRPRSA